MQIITNGDFIFPTHAVEYVRDQLYMWTYSKGTPNLDEIIRLLTHLPLVLVFIIFGGASNNLAVSYFYLAMVTATSLAVAYYFLHRFLQVPNRAVCLVLAIFYTFNPIFLGNYSKVGLVLAANMLPLLLTLIKRYRQTRRFSFILWAILALNVSFVHPFNLTFNVLCIGSYILFLCWQDRRFLRETYKAWLLGGICCGLINAFMILPIFSIGTVNKSALSQNISDPTLMSANLVEIANTGNIFTAFSMSKNIFLDYNFYDKSYQVLYYLGALLLYALLLGLLVYVNHHLSRNQKKQVTLCLLGLLSLLVMSTGTFLGIGKLLTFAIGLPGGWAFRSPLKWQFYMPLLLITLFAIVLVKIPHDRWRRLSMAGLMSLLVMLSGYISYDIVAKLLKPKNISHLYVLSAKTPVNGRVLLVRDDACIDYFNKNGSLANEINAIYYEKSVQVKEVSPEYLPTLNAANYNQILACKPLSDLDKYGLFNKPEQLAAANATFYSYHNKRPRGISYATVPVLAPGQKLTNLPAKYEFLRGKLAEPFDFVDEQQPVKTDWVVRDAFENVTTKEITSHGIRKTFHLDGQNQRLASFYNQSNQPVYYQYDPNKRVVQVSAQPKPGYETLDKQPLDLGRFSGNLEVWYEDDVYDFSNLVKNPSFEQGPWKNKVDDCFNYDDNPILGMRLNYQHKSDGKQALQLEALRHLACTNPPRMAIEAASQYLLGIDYRTEGRAIGRYSLSFDDKEKTNQARRLEATAGQWQTYTEVIQPPQAAKHTKLTLFGVPHQGVQSVTQYDNLQLVRLPNIAGRFFILQQPAEPAKGSLPNISAKRQNPSQIKVSVKQPRRPFYMVMNDTYHRGWVLTASSQALPHVLANGHENMWLVDTTELCSRNHLCQPAELALQADFKPQRWYNLGLLISGLAIFGAGLYIVREHKQGRQHRPYRRQIAASARRLHD